MIAKKRILNLNCAFTARDGVSVVSLDGTLILLGGWNNTWTPVTCNEVWTSPDGITWTQQADAPWSDKHSFGCKVMGSTIYVMGSDVYDTTANRKKVWGYTVAGGWTLITSDWGAGARVLHSVTVHNVSGTDYLYLFGGQVSEVESDGFFNDIYRSSDGITWTLVATAPVGLQDRSTAAFYSMGGNLYVAGGGRYNNTGAHSYYDDVWKSTDNGVTWTQIGSDSRIATMYPNGEVWNSKLWYLRGANITGVVSGVGNRVGLLYSSDGITWDEVPYNVPPRHAAATTIHNGDLYIVAGNMWNDSHRFIDITA